MAPSYKTLWQEASQEIDRLKARVQTLTRLNDELAFALNNARDPKGTAQIVDLAGIARHMRAERFTPQQWKQRGHLPPVDFPEIREPLWYVSTLKEQFVIPTRRVWYDVPPEDLSPAA